MLCENLTDGQNVCNCNSLHQKMDQNFNGQSHQIIELLLWNDDNHENCFFVLIN